MSFISISPEETEEMLQSIGVGSISELFSDIPEDILIKSNLELPEALPEHALAEHMSTLAAKNNFHPGFLGAGAYQHYIPAAVDELSLRSEFYTAYTPYQPEVSQGTLTAIFEFQTMMTRLTGMELTNASMYDGATACAESILMSCAVNKKNRAVISSTLHPSYCDVIKTYSWASSTDIEFVESKDGATNLASIKNSLDKTTGCVVIQSPNFFGTIEDLQEISTVCKEVGAHLIVVVNEPHSMALLKSPGDCGADIVCGEAQAFGNYVGYGGPMLGFISAKKNFIRRIPGRLVGISTDEKGREVFVLTLQTREQHIRREKATSNICTNEGLLVLRAVIYLSLYGPKLRDCALLNHRNAVYLKNQLLECGFELVHKRPFFNEFVVRKSNAKKFLQQIEAKGYNAGLYLGDIFSEYEDCILCCATENHSQEMVDAFITVVKSIK